VRPPAVFHSEAADCFVSERHHRPQAKLARRTDKTQARVESADVVLVRQVGAVQRRAKARVRPGELRTCDVFRCFDPKPVPPRSLPIVTDRPRTSRISGPAHHRINAENAYFYRTKANSRIAVTPKVTPVIAAAERAARSVGALREYLWGRPAILRQRQSCGRGFDSAHTQYLVAL